MNLILLTHSDFIDSHRVSLTGRRHLHIKNVLKVGTGDLVACGMCNAHMGTGVILHIDDNKVDMAVILDQAPPSPLPVTLVLALPRPKMLKRIIQNVTSLGVKEMYLVNSWRVEKSFWNSPVLTDEKLCEYARLGLEQAKDTQMPHIHKKRFFAKFVKQELPKIAKNCQCILAHPNTPHPKTPHPKTPHPCSGRGDQPLVLAVGPEGGWIDLEVKTLEDTGFVPCSIGPRILTVETAVISLLSRLYK